MKDQLEIEDDAKDDDEPINKDDHKINKLWLKLCQAHTKVQFGFLKLHLNCI